MQGEGAIAESIRSPNLSFRGQHGSPAAQPVRLSGAAMSNAVWRRFDRRL